MELVVRSELEFAKLLFEVLNENGIYLIDTSCHSVSLEARKPDVTDADEDIKHRIYVEYQQVSYDELRDAIKIFLDRYSSRDVQFIEDQKGSMFMENHKVSYDEGEYYYCTCPFHQNINKVCHHIVALWIRRKEGTAHLKAVKVTKDAIRELPFYNVETGELRIPILVDSWLYSRRSKRTIYEMLKYGLSIAEIREHYDIMLDTGYAVINALGGLVDKKEIKIRRKKER